MGKETANYKVIKFIVDIQKVESTYYIWVEEEKKFP